MKPRALPCNFELINTFSALSSSWYVSRTRSTFYSQFSKSSPPVNSLMRSPTAFKLMPPAKKLRPLELLSLSIDYLDSLLNNSNSLRSKSRSRRINSISLYVNELVSFINGGSLTPALDFSFMVFQASGLYPVILLIISVFVPLVSCIPSTGLLYSELVLLTTTLFNKNRNLVHKFNTTKI